MLNRISFCSTKRVIVLGIAARDLTELQLDQVCCSPQSRVASDVFLAPAAATEDTLLSKSSMKEAECRKRNKSAVSFSIPKESSSENLQQNKVLRPPQGSIKLKAERVVKTARVPAKHKPASVIQWKSNRAVRASHKPSTSSGPSNNLALEKYAVQHTHVVSERQKIVPREVFDLQTTQVVPEWARGPALEAALDAQYNGEDGAAPADPDMIFQCTGLCDLDAVFEACDGSSVSNG